MLIVSVAASSAGGHVIRDIRTLEGGKKYQCPSACPAEPGLYPTRCERQVCISVPNPTAPRNGTDIGNTMFAGMSFDSMNAPVHGVAAMTVTNRWTNVHHRVDYQFRHT